MPANGGYGVSSIGRVAVSKTVGWGFKSLTPCQLILWRVTSGGWRENVTSLGTRPSPLRGEVAEWSIAAVLKTASGESLTGVRIPPSPPTFACDSCRAPKRSEGGPWMMPVRAAARRAKDFVNKNLIAILVWVVVIGAAFAFAWYKGYLARLSNYVALTREELRKCNWPTWDELRGSTVVVGISILLLGGFTVCVDFIFSMLVRWIT